VPSSRAWFLILLLLSFAVGNWSELVVLAERPGQAKLTRAAAGLFRAIAAGGITLCSPSLEGPVSFMGAAQGISAAARGARVLIRERITLSALIEGSNESTFAAQGMIAMEAWCVLVLLPCMLRSRRHLSMLTLLVAPCFLLAQEGRTAAKMEVYLEPAAFRLGNAVCVMAIVLVFLGGVPTMLAVCLLAQVIAWVHKLDKAKF